MDFVFLKEMEIIQLNKFSSLHDGNRIIFCKTDFILNEFQNISNIENDVIFITGNSDYAITEEYFNLIPKNIKKWYAQNVLVFNDIIEPIPMGIENKNESVRTGHGIGYYDRVLNKENLLNRKINKVPNKKIYANFQINTNYHHRYPIMEICKKSSFIDWDDPILSLDNFFDKILDYEMVVCPAGNGVDTHRIWEILYSNRVPITIKVGEYKIYDLYEKLPIIILNNINELEDYDLIIEKFNNIKNKDYNLNYLDYYYWENNILSQI